MDKARFRRFFRYFYKNTLSCSHNYQDVLWRDDCS